jgi:hypothetical protein
MTTSIESKEEKEREKRDIIIKCLIQRVCTPVSSAKRLKAVRSFFDTKGLKLDATESMYAWKGLFYAVWYTEMGKGCEELNQTIAEGCQTTDGNLLLAGFKSLSTEWFGIDYIRVDKFAHLVRHLLRSALKLEFSKKASGRHNGQFISEILASIDGPVGFLHHFLEIYVAELLPALNKKYQMHEDKASLILDYVKPFVHILETSDDMRTLKTVSADIYHQTLSEIETTESVKTVETFVTELSSLLMSKGKSTQVKRRNRDAMYRLAELMTAKIKELNDDNEESKPTKKRKGRDERGEKPKRTRFVRSLVPVALK